MAIKCISATKKDVGELTNLFMDCFKNLYFSSGFFIWRKNIETLLEMLVSEAEVKVIREKGKIVGFVCYTHNLKELHKSAFNFSHKWIFPWNSRLIMPSRIKYAKNPYILFLAVHPDCNGKGFGLMLQKKAITSMKKPVYAEILVKNNAIYRLSLKNSFKVQEKARFGRVLVLRHDG